MNRLELTGLTVRPAQVWGGIRLVPLVREAPVEGLRLHQEVYRGLGADPGPGVVDVGPRSHSRTVWSRTGRVRGPSRTVRARGVPRTTRGRSPT
ncbi:hypothetical protein [Streptomyces sp. LN590]|uniref:ARPP-2 domain-containing protein n=1 Tax=unclassified Streptomyces TaxID=2593676 RepID=UPI003715C756